MAGRIRTIKPETLSDPKAARLSDAAWRLWISSWTLADDLGQLPADPVWLSCQVFWIDRRNCTPIIAELTASGLVRPYSVNGDPYLEIAGWKKHQKINRPSGARYPSPPTLTEGSLPPTTTTTFDLLPSTNTAAAAGFDFEAVYVLYPRKGDGKAKGIERLSRQVTSAQAYEQVLTAAQHYADKISAEQTPLQYVKRFDTWCNGHWRDYIDGPHIVESKRTGAASKSNHREPMPHGAGDNGEF
ncbi:MAG TPA: hypothetical protein VN623_11595 [Hyphomicrobium sp.]|uniref:hypothetical protein n=1 Tax=Hyphomicrobium sp. TaxID=82 RepID=UPI002CFA701F|nr:hypothetical protein [Hyphomicrobium sp.]HXE02580.1 hypothetical protein [Hyphomicrobium sp.]